MKAFLWIAGLALLAGAGWYFLASSGSRSTASRVQYRTAKVERGEVVEGVAASGTVQPVVLVQVGTQVSGVIEKLFVDFNSKVTAGQTIALLDSRRLAAQVAQDEAGVAHARADLERIKSQLVQARAEVGRARASLAQSKADVDRVQALSTQAEKDLERQAVLAERKLTSPADYDAAVANKGSFAAQLGSARASVDQFEAAVAVAEATVLGDEAQISVGEATVAQTAAQLQGDKVNFDYATIKSPVDGVVVSRNVDVGQTVAASLQAPTLFLIAQDLTKVQVQTSVPEADVGKVHEGQTAHFSVDAHLDKSFEGVVSQVRLASTTVQNVVTYTVLVDASNPEGLLLPGMTANVTFEIVRSANDALYVPTSALRLQATAVAGLVENPEVLESAKAAGGGAPKERGPKAPPSDGEPGKRSRKREGHASEGFVYAQTPTRGLHAIAVRVGISDGVKTVVEPVDAGALEEGTEIVTAVIRDEEAATTNPFGPPRMGGGSTRGTGLR